MLRELSVTVFNSARTSIKINKCLKHLRPPEKSKKQEYDRLIKYKFVFLHIPKAAGISVNECLYNNMGFGHTTYGNLTRFYSNELLQELKIFTIVREPIDRFTSAYNFLLNGGMNSFDRKAAENMSPNINEFIKNQQFIKGLSYRSVHFEPSYWYAPINKVNNIKVFKLEDRSLEEKLSNFLGYSIKLPYLNVLKYEKIKMTTQNEEYLRNWYYKDYELFNY